MKHLLAVALGLAAVTAFASAGRADPSPSDAPVLVRAALSPNGEHVATLTRRGGEIFIEVSDGRGTTPTRIDVSKFTVIGLEFLDNDHLEMVRRVIDPGGRVTSRQTVPQGVSINLRTNKTAYLLQGTTDTAPVLLGSLTRRGTLTGRPVLFMRGLMTGPAFALFATDLDSGVGRRLTPPSLDASDWLVRPDGAILARAVFDPKRLGSRIEVAAAAGLKSTSASTAGYRLRGLSPDGASVLVQGGGRVVAVSLKDGSETELAPPAGRAFDGLGFGGDGRLQVASLVGDTPEYVFFDASLAATWARARAELPNSFLTLGDASDSGASLLVTATNAHSLGTVYWVRPGAALQKLGELRPDVPSDRVADIRRIVLTAGDNLPLPSVLSLPPHHLSKPPPVLVVAPSEPEDAAPPPWFEPLRQDLADAGYAALWVDVRGSHVTKASYAAGAGALETGMKSDLADAVADLGRRGLVDAHRACVAGTRLGAYVALKAAALASAPFRCAVVENPVIDINEAVRWPDELCRGCDWTTVAAERRAAGADVSAVHVHVATSSLLETTDASRTPVLILRRDLLAGAAEAARLDRVLAAAHVPVQTAPLADDSLIADRERQDAILEFLRRNDPAD